MKIESLLWTRIIPADAGSTLHNNILSSAPQDHPRGCGEHDLRDRERGSGRGSSPRMRGARSGIVNAVSSGRIIPADAGSTSPTTGTARLKRDHPRGCGEHVKLRVCDMCMMGSSPRMRGALILGPSRYRSARIIPADAGSTTCSCSAPIPPRDHPRGCGEHSGWANAAARNGGSSPRMRGALQLGSINRQITGIIPADAGSTSLMFFGRFGRRDHPRGCGEHGKGLKNGGISPGSSPRMRGAPYRSWQNRS